MAQIIKHKLGKQKLLGYRLRTVNESSLTYEPFSSNSPIKRVSKLFREKGLLILFQDDTTMRIVRDWYKSLCKEVAAVYRDQVIVIKNNRSIEITVNKFKYGRAYTPIQHQTDSDTPIMSTLLAA